jgi:hypothetical protein
LAQAIPLDLFLQFPALTGIKVSARCSSPIEIQALQDQLVIKLSYDRLKVTHGLASSKSDQELLMFCNRFCHEGILEGPRSSLIAHFTADHSLTTSPAC